MKLQSINVLDSERDAQRHCWSYDDFVFSPSYHCDNNKAPKRSYRALSHQPPRQLYNIVSQVHQFRKLSMVSEKITETSAITLR